MDRFAGMAVFVKVVEGSSFAAAARHFRMSAAMVSNHVRAIEERLGVRFLNRTTRRVSPTEVGHGTMNAAYAFSPRWGQAERAAGDQNTTPRGLLRVSAPVTFGTVHVAPAIADYLAVYPDVSVELVLNDRFVDLLEEGFDVAIRVGQLPDSSLIARRLINAQTILCASPQYLKRHGEPNSLHDLAHHNCLAHSLSTPHNEWRLVDHNGASEAMQVSGRFTANNGDVLRILALKGEGIVCLPAFIVDADLAAGRLIRILPDLAAMETPASAVYPPGQFLSAKVRAFVDFVAGHLNRTPAHQPESADVRSRRVSPRTARRLIIPITPPFSLSRFRKSAPNAAIRTQRVAAWISIFGRCWR
jgi:DNA-binding transcriptional LysR family regulator